jgi:hypothetical protein
MTFGRAMQFRENKPSDGTVGTNTLILRDVLDGAPKNARKRRKPAKAGFLIKFEDFLLQRLP